MRGVRRQRVILVRFFKDGPRGRQERLMRDCSHNPANRFTLLPVVRSTVALQVCRSRGGPSPATGRRASGVVWSVCVHLRPADRAA